MRSLWNATLTNHKRVREMDVTSAASISEVCILLSLIVPNVRPTGRKIGAGWKFQKPCAWPRESTQQNFSMQEALKMLKISSLNS